MMTEKEITKLKRAIYIWENIGISCPSSFILDGAGSAKFGPKIWGKLINDN